jgi:hypothetical protein
MSLPYRVLVDDNFHYMDEDERREHGRYATPEEAIGACAMLVDQSLEASYKPGMTAAELLAHYASFGDDPFIVGPPSAGQSVPFSARDYAQRRVDAVCAAHGRACSKHPDQ